MKIFGLIRNHILLDPLKKKQWNAVFNNVYNLYSTVNKLQTEPKSEWNVAIKEAEKVVGYPTSFLNLRWLLNDEIANIATHLRKLMGTDHPLLKTAKEFLFTSNTPAWGLVVLLVSRAAGVKSKVADIECDRTAGILHSQRVLAEVTEMIRTSVLIHKGLLNVDPSWENVNDMNYGNKVALLSGDYLLSKCFRDLAGLRNHHVNEIISSTLRDFAECEFLDQRDNQNFPLPCKPNKSTSTSLFDKDLIDEGPYPVNDILGNSKEEWVLRSLLGGANLLAKSCKAALILGGHEDYLQSQAYLFGKYLALAWQAKLDYDNFIGNKGNINLISAPIMLHLSKNSSLYDEIIKGAQNVENCNFSKIQEIIHTGNSLSETKEMQHEFAHKALIKLKTFENSDARIALENVVKAM